MMEHIRSYFPALSREQDGEKVIHFDGPGGGQTPIAVTEAITNYMLKHNANHGSQFSAGRETVEMVADIRSRFAGFINACYNEVSFGQNMTSLTFSFSRALARTWKKGDKIILSSIDHDANIEPWRLAAEEREVEVVILPFDPEVGTIRVEDLQARLCNRTKLVAITVSSNVLGCHVDVVGMAKAAHSVGAKIYVDAVHHVPHYKVDVKAWDCDFMACSAYKFFGPHVSILYGKAEYMTTLQPYKIEPSPEMAPYCWETGTQSFEAIAGLGATLDYLLSVAGPSNDCFEASYRVIGEHENLLKKKFLEELNKRPEWKLHGLNEVEQRASTFAITREGYTADQLAKKLGSEGVYSWGGNMYAIKLMPYLGIDPNDGVLRLGMMHYNTLEEIDRFFSILDRSFD